MLRRSLKLLSPNNCLRVIRHSSDSINSEVNGGVKRIRLWKRLFAVSLFGATLTTALLVRRHRRKEWLELLQQMRRLQGEKFGDLELFEFRDLILPEPVIKSWRKLEKFNFRATDVVLMSFPKTGITWLQEIVWLLANDLDFETAKSKSIAERFPFLEFPTPGIHTIDLLESPRFIKTHLTPTLLFKNNNNEESFAKLPKILAIMRNPKDVLVSYYHFCRMNYMIGYKESFDEFFDRFAKGSVPYGPIWTHYLDVIKLKEYDLAQPFDNNRVLIVLYEELKHDFENQINKISDFLGKQRLSDSQMLALKTHCSFEQMRANPSVNYKYWDDLGLRDKSESEFMRKGEIGDWKRYLNGERNDTINALISAKLGDKINFIYE